MFFSEMETGTAGLILLAIAMVVYGLLDIWIALRDGWSNFRSSLHDREVRQVTAALFSTWLLAITAALAFPSLELPGSGWPALIVGVVMTYAAIAFRLWAVLTLGRFFRRVVVIQEGHRVITEGPYRFARHPAYTGMLLAQLGFGIALGNLLSIAICLVVPSLGFVSRIRAEETALEAELGDEYRTYAARTKRLLPGLW